MKTYLLTGMLALFCFLNASAMQGQSPAANNTADTTVVTFRFLPGQDMFYIPWAGNDGQLDKLYGLVEKYRTDIAAGRMPVQVDGYCTSGANAEESFRIAVSRSNRVKSELITRKGLAEGHFVTKNHATAYAAPEGKSYRDMVVVTLRIPAKGAEDAVAAEQERRKQAERERQAQAERERTERERAQAQAERERAEREKAEAERAARERAENDAAAGRESDGKAVRQQAGKVKPYCVAVRTNLLYDAMLLPTLGMEWRMNEHVGIRLDGSLSWWGDEHGKVQKMWMLNPEVRWYLLRDKRFYVGASGSYGEYNIYEYMLGGMLTDDTGYQGKLWNAGVTVGYQLYLSRGFSVDFNLGLGYSRSEYDSFTMMDRVRVYKDRNRSKSFWGPTQAGISLVWTIGGNK